MAYIHDNSGKHFDPELVRIFAGIMPTISQISQEFKELADAEEDLTRQDAICPK